MNGIEYWGYVTGTWNQKNLDYEIETGGYYGLCGQRNSLEIKRTSITRLKLRRSIC